MASEFALAFMLLIGAGLMIRSFAALQSVDPGIQSAPRALDGGVGGRIAGGRTGAARDLLSPTPAAGARLPGVESAGGINHLPLAGDLWGWPFTIEGRPKPRPGESPAAVYRIVMPGYFETMRLPLLRGRAITDTDDARAPGVVIINERAAGRYWPGQDPIGKRITFDDDNAIRPHG